MKQREYFYSLTRIRFARTLVVTLLLSGCASTQLNNNALDLASTSKTLVVSQILSNLAQFQIEEFAIPSQVSIPSGSVTTTIQAGASVSSPLNSSWTNTNTAATAAGAAIPAITGTTTKVLAAFSLTPSASDQASQNWALAPLQDPDQMRRLRALYRFGVGRFPARHLPCEYPLVQATATTANSNQYTWAPDIEACKLPVGKPDPAFLARPGCIICDNEVPSDKGGQISLAFANISDTITVMKGKITPSDVGKRINGYCMQAGTTIASVESPESFHISTRTTCEKTKQSPEIISWSTTQHLLEVNPALSNSWLWNPNHNTPADQSRSLGAYAGRELYFTARPEAEEEFSDFVFFVLEATLEAAAQTGGGQTANAKGTPQKAGAATLFLPASSTTLLRAQ